MVDSVEDRMCLEHAKPLELFWKTDQSCIYSVCSVLDHNTHYFVPLKEYEDKKAELKKTDAKIQQLILNRWLKIQEIKELLKISKAAAGREDAEGLRVFTDFMDSVEKNKKSFVKKIKNKQKTAENLAEGFNQRSGTGHLWADEEKFWGEALMLWRTPPPPPELQVTESCPVHQKQDWRQNSSSIIWGECGESCGSAGGGPHEEDEEDAVWDRAQKSPEFEVDAQTLDPQTAHLKLALSHNGKTNEP